MIKVSLREDYDRAFEEALKALKAGRPIIYPTDTVYGIGAVAIDKQAVEKVYRAKRRKRSKAVSVLVGNLAQVLRFFKPSSEEVRYIYQYMPGPYTFIIDAKDELKTGLGFERVGLRVPDNYFIRKLAIEVGAPIITTSANISGNDAHATAEEIEKEEAELLKEVSLIIDAGPLKHGEPSTVVDIKEKKILRQGAGNFRWLNE